MSTTINVQPIKDAMSYNMATPSQNSNAAQQRLADSIGEVIEANTGGIHWLGTFSSPPGSPSINDAYRDSTLAGVYIWTGSIWELMVEDGSSGGGSFIVNTAHGFSGVLLSGALTLSTTVTGLIKGDGTNLSAAVSGTDYSLGTSSLTTGILKSTTASGTLSIAVAADFPTLNQNTTGTAANITGVVDIPNGGTNLTTLGSALQILQVNSGGTVLQYSTLNTSIVPESGNLYYTNARGIGSVLTGYISGSGTVASSDTILQAIQKLNGNVGLLTGAMIFQGLWNASTNTPTLVSGVGTKGYIFKVSVAGTTTLDGQSVWNVGDQVVFDGTTWDRLEGDATEVLSVNGLVGNVPLTGTVNKIDVSIANVFTISPTYVGQTSITTLGTIGTGTWQATAITDTYISSASTWNAKQAALSGTGIVKSVAGTISYLTDPLPLNHGGTATVSLTLGDIPVVNASSFVGLQSVIRWDYSGGASGGVAMGGTAFDLGPVGASLSIYGQMAFIPGAGAVTNLLGPPDQAFKIVAGTPASGAGKALTLAGSDATSGPSIGGAASLTGGTGIGTGGSGGSTTISGGTFTVTGTTGGVTIMSPNIPSTVGNTGDINLGTGNGVASGSILLRVGKSSTSGAPGSISLLGNSTATGTVGQLGTSIILTSGVGGANTGTAAGNAGNGGPQTYTLGPGGATAGAAGGFSGGNGGIYSIVGGVGGANSGSTTSVTYHAGNGTTYFVTLGNGGNATGAGTTTVQIAGNGGGGLCIAGNGGNASGAGTGTRTGGDGGSWTWQTGTGGTGTTTNGSLGEYIFKIGATQKFKINKSGHCELAGNAIFTSTTLDYLITGGAATAGTATLVAGTKAVATTAVAATDIIIVTLNTPAVSASTYAVPSASIIAGTSFVINAITPGGVAVNVVDTSTVNWVIFHTH